MLVKVILPHSNGYGDKHVKVAGDEYDLPDDFVDALTAAGLVEAGEPAKAAKPVRAKKPAGQNDDAAQASGSAGANGQD